MFNFRRFTALFRPALYTPLELALRALARGQYEEALARFDGLREETALNAADRAAVANKRGVTLVNLGRPQEAGAAFEEALTAVPRYAPALVNLGNLQLESGDVRGAVRLYEQAVLSDDRYAPAHHNLGVAYKRLGRLGDAIREFRSANRLEARALISRDRRW